MSFPERESNFLPASEAKHRQGETKGSELVFGRENERNFGALEAVFIGVGVSIFATSLAIQIIAINKIYAERRQVVKAGYIPPRRPLPIFFNGVFGETKYETWPLGKYDEFANQYGFKNYSEMKTTARERDITVEELSWGILEERGVVGERK